MMQMDEAISQKIPSLTKWLEKIKIPNILEFKDEDNNKYRRLEILCKILPIHYNIPQKVRVADVMDNTSKFQSITNKWKNQMCNWRLIPKEPTYPKLRIRAVKFENAHEWFKQQNINPNNYQELEVIKYNPNVIYSAIFLINNLGVWGEVVRGDLWQLAYGIHKIQPTIFTFDFKKLSLFSTNQQTKKVTKLINKVLNTLCVSSIDIQERLRETLNAEFTPQGYLKGYFEFVSWPTEDVLFMDYNRVIYKMLGDYNFLSSGQRKKQLTGICASPGTAQGYIQHIIDPNKEKFKEHNILVCKILTIDHLPAMKKSKAIIVEQGNILSHASIVSRELNKPCLVNVRDASKLLKNNDLVRIDATKGVITKL